MRRDQNGTERKMPSLNLFSGSWREALMRARYGLAVMLLLTMPVLAQVKNKEEICVKIDKVGEAPGVWSGLIASTQWLDATVIASSSKDYKVGDKSPSAFTSCKATSSRIANASVKSKGHFCRRDLDPRNTGKLPR